MSVVAPGWQHQDAVSVGGYGQHGYCTCPTAWWGVNPPPLCGYCQHWRNQPVWAPVYTPVASQPLSDADIERIAKRVAELLKGSTETI